MGLGKEINKFIFGQKEKKKRISKYSDEEQPLRNEQLEAASGNFAKTSDYYKDVLSGKHDLKNVEAEYTPMGKYKPVENDYFNKEYNQNAPGFDNYDQDWQAMQAPEMRKYNEQVVPDLAEQFAGMGAGGGTGSSGFYNSLGTSFADLGERLGKMKADLRQQTLSRQQEMMKHNDTMRANQDLNRSNLDLENNRLGLDVDRYNNTNENNFNLANVNGLNNTNLNNLNNRNAAGNNLTNLTNGALSPGTDWMTTRPETKGLVDYAAPAIAEVGTKWLSGKVI